MTRRPDDNDPAAAVRAKSHADLLAVAADEFTTLCESGAAPEIEQFVLRYPELADDLRQLLPALQAFACERPAPGSPLPIRERLGDFRLKRELGRGGMGVVYEAEECSLGRTVALKILPYAAVLDERCLTRFRNEARAAATLNHPHIVPVYSIGTERGVHYYAMQLIEGASLAALIESLRGSHTPLAAEVQEDDKRGTHVASADSTNTGMAADHFSPVPASAIASISNEWQSSPTEYVRSIAGLAQQIAEALDYAHTRGIVHRDIKPANLLLDQQAHVWVTDFGLAHHENDTSLTVSGDILGTFRYMSPEQATGERGIVDQRSDVYSLGVTLYELLTLQPALNGQTRAELMRQITDREPTPCGRLNPHIPRDLQTIVQRAIEKLPESRYSSAAELAADLERFLHGTAIIARPVAVREKLARGVRRHAGRIAAITAMLALLTLISLVSTFWIASERAATRSALKAEREQRERADANLRLARDTLYDAFVKEADDIANSPHMTDRQRAFCEKVVDFYEHLPLAEAGDETVQMESAQAYERLAHVYRVLGNSQAAATASQTAYRLLTQLAERPDSPVSYRLQLAELNLARAHSAWLQGRYDEVATLHQEVATTLATTNRTLTDDSDRLHHLVLSATLKHYQANIAARLDDTHSAQLQFEQAVSLAKQLIDDYPPTDNNQYRLAHVETDYGAWLHQSTGAPEAIAWYKSAAERLQQLLIKDPARISFQLLLARLESDLGTIYQESGRTSEAAATLHDSLDIWNRLVADFPQRPDLRLGRSATLANLASILHDQRDYAEAGELLQQSLADAQLLIEQAPEDPRYRERLAATCHNLAVNYRRLGQNDECERLAAMAIDEWQRLVTEFADDVHYLRLLAHGYRSLAAELDDRAALDSYQKAEELLHQLAKRFPDSPEYTAQLCSLYDTRAQRYADLERLDEALDDHRRSLALATELCERWPASPDHFAKRSRRLRRLGLYHLGLGQYTAAAEQFANAVDAEHVVAERFPEYQDRTYITPTASLHLCWASAIAQAAGSETADARTHFGIAAQLAADAGTVGRVLSQATNDIRPVDALAYYQAVADYLETETGNAKDDALRRQRRYPILVEVSNRLIRADRWDEAALIR
ncbi:MAG: serine/threonine protein kinase [Planctomycetales bacterium]|nr:serine/threonine protein kinase [Planctomycetales bacterium]